MPELPPPLPPGERTVGQLDRRDDPPLRRQLLARAAARAADRRARPARPRTRQRCPRRALPRVRAVPRARVRLRLHARRQGRPRHADPRRRDRDRDRVLLPASLVFTWFALLAAVYLSFFGLAVPAAVLEGAGVRASLRAAVQLGRADWVHALGSIAALVIVFFLSRQVLVSLLHGQADETMRVAIFLADVVLAPLMLLGTAMLYFDQAARVGVDRKRAGARPTPKPSADPADSCPARRLRGVLRAGRSGHRRRPAARGRAGASTAPRCSLRHRALHRRCLGAAAPGLR